MNAPRARERAWTWIVQGMRLFRAHPGGMLSVFFAFMLFNMLLGGIPWLGNFLPLLLIPLCSQGFMEACRTLAARQRLTPQRVLTGFRAPPRAELLKLGLLYPCAIGLALFGSQTLGSGVLWNLLVREMPLRAHDVAATDLLLDMSIAGVLYLPALMAFWFAAPLITWNGMSFTKAMFFSFFTVQRHASAFLWFAFYWLNLGIVLPSLLSLILAALIGQPALALMLMFPASAALSTILYCTFYVTYADFFEEQAAQRILA